MLGADALGVLLTDILDILPTRLGIIKFDGVELMLIPPLKPTVNTIV